MSKADRNRQNLEFFLAALLEEVPAPKLGRLIEGVVTRDGDRNRAHMQVNTWAHEGFRQFVKDLADRLQEPDNAGN